MSRNFLSNLIARVMMIVRIKEISIYAMYNSIAVAIRFIREGFPAKSVAFHFVGVKSLYVFYECIEFCVDVWLWLPPSWYEID